MPNSEIDLNFIARQLNRVLTELRNMRDDNRVMLAMMQRHDNTLKDVVAELNAIHQWMISTSERVQKLEQSDTP